MKAGKDESMQALRIPLLPIEVGIMDGDSTRGTPSSAIASWRAHENNFGTANLGMTGEKTTRDLKPDVRENGKPRVRVTITYPNHSNHSILFPPTVKFKLKV